ncbi:FadR/GntR family transcriptional regulator [Bradyrhizobium sp. LB11.1]|uniref:FadR/GntR family transcriptional regulator n=1 Tax=Bradyrhizobium sp. LB11.1 TaxID=3156326 RepID=UPI00339914D5
MAEPNLKKRTAKVAELPRSPATGRLSDRVYDHVLGHIAMGILPIDCRLPPENGLADLLDVSRPVVREALMRLRDDGLIASRQGAGWFVTRRPAANAFDFAPVSSIPDIQRCFIFRMAVEGDAAALAARNRDRQSLRRIHQVLTKLDAMVAQGREGGLGVEEDLLFHRTIAEASGNRFFVETLTSLREQIAIGVNLNRNLSLIQPRGRILRGQQEHRRVFEAVEAQDEEGARRAMRTHVDNARKRIFEGG